MHVLAVLLAALCHDVDHPGLSNKFLLSTRETPEAAAAAAEAAIAKTEEAKAKEAEEKEREAEMGEEGAADPMASVLCMRSGGSAEMGRVARKSSATGAGSYDAGAHPMAARHGGRTMSVAEAHHAVGRAPL